MLLLIIVLSCVLLGSWLFGGRSTKSPYGTFRYRVEKEVERMDADTIRRTLDSLVDTRPARCRDHAFEFTRLDADETVSIVVEFHGATFFDLKLALTAIVEHTPYDLYKEVVVLDDGTENESIRKQASVFLTDPKFNKVKIYRSETHDGQVASWFKASAATTGSILIFVDSSAVVSHGWIQPLLAKVIDDPNLIAVPHADNLLDDNRFFRTDDGLINVLTFSLSTLYYENVGSAASDMMDTPVMRGDVIAMRRSLLEGIGGFDDKLKPEPGGGLHLELSLRTWMCGGAVRLITCSRVAVRNSLRPRRITDVSNYRRIVELWFDEFRNVAYYQASIAADIPPEEKALLAQRRAYLQKILPSQCKPFSWYLTNIASMVIAPSDGMHRFGKLRAKTGYCVQTVALAGDNMGAVQMALCREYMYEPAALFEMSADGMIFRGDRCLEPDKTGRLVAGQCSDDHPNQRWTLMDSRLTLTSQPQQCLTHVSERDADTMDLFHYAHLKKCSDLEADLRKQKWKFLNF
jgi:polypeptide N-acetylgalactosaminyltransferase